MFAFLSDYLDKNSKNRNIQIRNIHVYLSCLNRPMTSNGKKRIYPLSEELTNLFVFGNDYTEGAGGLDPFKFWYDVIEGLTIVWRCRCSYSIDSILLTPLYYGIIAI